MRIIKKISTIFPKKVPLKERKLLVIFAHPDDETINVGGILAQAASEEIKTYVMCLSKGEFGIVDKHIKNGQLKEIREKELKYAAAILGVHDATCFDFTDSRFFYEQEKIKATLISALKEMRPQVIITHDPSGGTGHPDHITTSHLVKIVVETFFKGIIKLYFTVVGGNHKEIIKHILRNKDIWENIPEATHSFNMSHSLNMKTKALLAYKSQRLDQSKQIPITAWYSLFDTEYLHSVQLCRHYIFKYGRFKTKYINFNPSISFHPLKI